jgi:hypothetical protein
MMTTPVCDSKIPISVLSALVSCARAVKAGRPAVAIKTTQNLSMIASNLKISAGFTVNVSNSGEWKKLRAMAPAPAFGSARV